jgi:hypothetical protein
VCVCKLSNLFVLGNGMCYIMNSWYIPVFVSVCSTILRNVSVVCVCFVAISIGFRITKEMPGLVGSGNTLYKMPHAHCMLDN